MTEATTPHRPSATDDPDDGDSKPVPEPSSTDHPVGEEQAARNRDEEPPG